MGYRPLTMFDVCDGPECPGCGCTDTELYHSVRRALWHDKDSVLVRCNHCNLVFVPDAESRGDFYEVIYHPATPCPYCAGDKTKVTHTLRPVRYHVCRSCCATFRSREAGSIVHFD